MAVLGYATPATFDLPTISYDEAALGQAKSGLEAYIPEAKAADEATKAAAVEDFGKALATGYAYDVTHYAKAVKPYVNAFAAETDAVTFSDSCDVEKLGECIYTAVYAEVTDCCDFDAKACAEEAGCTCPWMENPEATEAAVMQGYVDAYENEMAIKEAGWNMFLGKLETAVDNYTANKAVEQQKYVSAAAGIAKSLKCDAAATDACAAAFPADVMGFEECMSTVPGCMAGVVSVDWGDLQAKYAAVEKVYGGIDTVTAQQWNDLAEVYNY